jgi:hypothetical protein
LLFFEILREKRNPNGDLTKPEMIRFRKVAEPYELDSQTGKVKKETGIWVKILNKHYNTSISIKKNWALLMKILLLIKIIRVTSKLNNGQNKEM